MTDDQSNLYREVILDHSKHPRNHRRLDDATGSAVGHNRLCGDKLRLFVKVEAGVIVDVAWQGSGCALSTASASLMTDAIKGHLIDDARAVFRAFHDLVTGPAGEHPPIPPELGKLAVFAGVRDYPVRVKCATLAWRTLEAALKNESALVSTE